MLVALYEEEGVDNEKEQEGQGEEDFWGWGGVFPLGQFCSGPSNINCGEEGFGGGDWEFSVRIGLIVFSVLIQFYRFAFYFWVIFFIYMRKFPFDEMFFFL